MTTKDRIQSRLNRSKRYVFTRDDFRDIAGYDQVGRALRTLVNEGKLMKVAMVFTPKPVATLLQEK